MWPRRRRPSTKDSVVDASVRLLKGEAVDLFTESGQGVPAWARLNLLAHAEPETLASLQSPRFPRAASWDAVVAYLATELLGVGYRQPADVAWLQGNVLVPLELALLGGQLPQPATPGQLATLVMTALGHAQVGDRDDQHGFATPGRCPDPGPRPEPPGPDHRRG